MQKFWAIKDELKECLSALGEIFPNAIKDGEVNVYATKARLPESFNKLEAIDKLKVLRLLAKDYSNTGWPHVAICYHKRKESVSACLNYDSLATNVDLI